MRRLLRLAARCYPAWWRRRYGQEFDALLDELAPGPREVFDVLMGAVTMQTRNQMAIPFLGALAGAVVAGLLTASTPTVYAASATIRLETPGGAAATGPLLESQLSGALPSDETRRAASVTVLDTSLDSGSTQTTLLMMYTDPDPTRAHQMAERLVAAVTAVSPAEILAAPVRPSSPTAPAYGRAIGTGGGAGLLLGLCGVLFLRIHRRRSAV